MAYVRFRPEEPRFSWVLIPVVILWCMTAPVLKHGFRADEDVANAAGYYAMAAGCKQQGWSYCGAWTKDDLQRKAIYEAVVLVVLVVVFV